MDTTTLHGPGEFIAALPGLLGRTPEEEVVVIGLDGRGMVVCAASVDSAELAVPELSPRVAPLLAGDLVAAGIQRVMAVSWTDAAPGQWCPALDELMPALETAGLEPSPWVTDGSRYWAPWCDDAECCPPTGRELPVARALPPSLNPAFGRHGRDTSPRATANERRSAQRAGDRWASRRDGDRDVWCRRSWELIRDADAASASVTWGKVVAALQDVRVRDALIVHWLGASAEVVDDVLVGRASEGVHRVMDGALRPGHAATPDAAVLAQAFEWCACALRVTRSRDRAVIYALEGVLAWWSADLRRAATFARNALACDAGYTLAILVAEMCAVGLGPGWQRGVDMPCEGNG